MLICHLSDLHIRAPGQLAYGRVDSERHLRECLAHVLAQPVLPDAVVITGDLTDRGQPEEYENLLGMLKLLPMPVYVIPGNHDDRHGLRQVLSAFDRSSGDDLFMHYTAPLLGLHLVALDTTVPGEGHGLLCAARLEWLEGQLRRLRGSPVLLLMHHPPFLTGIEHMDRVGLRVEHPLDPILRLHPCVVGILCGHLHRTIFRPFAGTIAMTCPSPAHQVMLNFAPHAPSEFIMEPPGYLLHRWTIDEGLTTFAVVIGSYAGPFPFYGAGTLSA
jgi:3',5'-cyclic-AMP phosphodiesterase